MIIAKSFLLDFRTKYNEIIKVNQYEQDGRVFEIQCMSDIVPINLTGATVTFYAKKPDGSILYNDCVITDALTGKVTYTMTEQTCTADGLLNCWIEIIWSSAVIRSFSFTIEVVTALDETEAIESTSEFTALETALATAAAAAAAVQLPVGSLYFNATDATNPATLLGYGTWESFGQGRVLVGVQTGDATFGTAGATGGAASVALSQDNLPAVSYEVIANGTMGGTNKRIYGDYGAAAGPIEASHLVKDGPYAGVGNPATVGPLGSGTAHNNLQPYVTVYIWKRTA